MIEKLHHNAYRCRDSEETRRFYEDFLGMPLVNCFEITETKTGRTTRVLHSFYAMTDGSCLAFFDAPDRPFEFRDQHDYDLHIALEVTRDVLEATRQRALAANMECRGISDHGLFDSIYLRDPNGYVIELVANHADHAAKLAEARRTARGVLDRWTQSR